MSKMLISATTLRQKVGRSCQQNPTLTAGLQWKTTVTLFSNVKDITLHVSIIHHHLLFTLLIKVTLLLVLALNVGIFHSQGEWTVELNKFSFQYAKIPHFNLRSLLVALQAHLKSSLVLQRQYKEYIVSFIQTLFFQNCPVSLQHCRGDISYTSLSAKAIPQFDKSTSFTLHPLLLYLLLCTRPNIVQFNFRLMLKCCDEWHNWCDLSTIRRKKVFRAISPTRKIVINSSTALRSHCLI